MGRAQARLMANQGASVAILDINRSGGEETVRDIENTGGRAIFFEVDCADPLGVESALVEIGRKLGPISHLFNTAGTVIVKPYDQTTEEEFDWLMGVNVKSAFVVTRRVVKQMVENGGGNIVLMSSVASLHGFGLEGVYGISKAAIHGMMINICAEYRQSNIRCNTVNPAFVRTPHGLSEVEKFREMGVDWSESALVATQLRMCEPEEVAAASVFLVSPAASFINGIAMNIDNGWLVAG